MARRRKRKTDEGGVNNAWINTFADLMNLLLCFFVLLFASSTIDSQKFEAISKSLARSIGVLEGGRTVIGDGDRQDGGLIDIDGLDENDQSDGETDGDDLEQDTKSMELEQAKRKLKEAMAAWSEATYEQTSELAEEYDLKTYVELTIDPNYRYVELTLKGSVLFDSGSAEIVEAAKPILIRVGELLKQFEGYGMEIVGHTDNVPMTSGNFQDNNWLSAARALSASEFLIKSCDLNPEHLKYSGRGEYEPVASNDTAEGRAQNRRIEIRIYNGLSS